MASFSFPAFEQQAEAFLRSRAARTWSHILGERATLGLERLYDEDFPDLSSLDLYIDLHEAAGEGATKRTELLALLATAHLEARTRDQAERLTVWDLHPAVQVGEMSVTARAAGARLRRVSDVTTRHEIESALRAATQRDWTDGAARWRDELATVLQPLGATAWNSYWDEMRLLHLADSAALAQTFLASTQDAYTHALGIYFGQLSLPLDDAWTSDAAWAFRAPRFDATFPSRELLPMVARSFGDLGIGLRENSSIKLTASSSDLLPTGFRTVPLHVPNEVRACVRLEGGYADYAQVFQATGQALHFASTDPTLSVGDRCLGDPTPTVGYGLLIERLLSQPGWLSANLSFGASSDFRIVLALARAFRARRAAALVGYERRLWDPEAPGARGADFEDTLGQALHIRHFSEHHLDLLGEAPWSLYRTSVVQLRAEVFAAQLARFLLREFDEEWWRNPRAGRFLLQELWRPGRRHSAEEILRFMGEPGLDSTVLSEELLEVLRPV